MPTFAFLETPQHLTIRLLHLYNAPLPLLRVYSFSDILHARVFSAQSHSTSELLRTL